MEAITLHAPRQHEIEALLDSLLDRGDKTSIAALLDTSLSNISQQCNPDEPLKSWVYQALRFVWAVSAVHPKAAHTLLAEVNRLAELWQGKRPAPPVTLATRHKELAEVIQAEIENRPAREQRKELLRAREVIDGRLHELDELAEKGAA